MQTMHLFAGGGGGLLCDLILGHEPIVAVEWDKYCCQVLREQAADGWFPGVHVWEGDVRLFDPSDYAGRVEVVHAGFPCTDISRAGNQAGVGEGTRSGLYREVLRIADIVRPRYLFMENVAAILANEFLGTVLGDLAARGYDARWTCVPASAAGAPHYRDRWWCLAERADTDSERKLQPEGYEPEQRGWAGDVGEDVADAPNKRFYKRRRFSRACKDVRFIRRNGRDGLSCCGQEKTQLLADPISDGLQRLRNPISGNGTAGASARGEASRGASEEGGNWWSVEPGICRVVNGIPNRAHRIKALGNAQVPLQAALAWKILGGP